jgi:hypothetical protein
VAADAHVVGGLTKSVGSFNDDFSLADVVVFIRGMSGMAIG